MDRESERPRVWRRGEPVNRRVAPGANRLGSLVHVVHPVHATAFQAVANTGPPIMRRGVVRSVPFARNWRGDMP